jgi:ElaB/YqjD/DUF883 family membrane-anchored ribosome-binding protein
MDQTNSSHSQGGTQEGIISRLREGATARVSQQKDTATKGLGSIAQAARSTTQQLREQQHDTIAEYIEQAAERLERFSSNLNSRSVSDLMSDVQRFARRQPALFVGAAFAAGLLGARFLKSSNNSAAGSPGRFGYGAGRGEYSRGGV